MMADLSKRQLRAVFAKRKQTLPKKETGGGPGQYEITLAGKLGENNYVPFRIKSQGPTKQAAIEQAKNVIGIHGPDVVLQTRKLR